MPHHIAAHRRTSHLQREAAFVVALDAYQHGGDPRAMLQAAGAVIESKRPIARRHADTISVVTDNLSSAAKTYGDAADEIWRWLAFREMVPRD